MTLDALRRAAAAVLLLLAVFHERAAACAPALHGTVRDETGATLAGTAVWLSGGGTRTLRVTDGGGRFSFEEPVPPGASLMAEAPGFRRLERPIGARDLAAGVDMVLVRAGFEEQVAVTATRRPARLADTAASVVVLTAQDLSASVPPALDEALRQLPGFSLFRRSGSRTANPTSQGASLRGIGASGASRAAVLDDGVPLNDPFGGWVAWGRVPRAAVGRVEVLRGGASDLYGSGALGGVIQLFRRSTDGPWAVALEASLGSQETPEASLFAGGRRGEWEAAAAAERFQTGGYVPIARAERGPVDTPAASRHTTIDLTLERAWGGGRIFARAATFEESRDNGTPLQENDTETRQLTLGGEWSRGSGSTSARVYAADQDYRQTFSAIAPDRSSERFTRVQRVPSDAAGGILQWAGAVHPRHLLVAGLEARHVEGESREEIPGDSGVGLVDAGGRERTASLFVEDVVTAGERLTLTAGTRLDAWWNAEGHSASTPVPDAPSAVTRFPDRSQTAWSPRLSLIYRLRGPFSLSASAYRSFRAPTLNELYRSFRVGNVLTLANEKLEPERLRGVEGAVVYRPAGGKAAGRLGVFWMEIEDSIGNVTVSSSPALVTRRRRNIGETRSAGVEADLDVRPAPRWRITAAYQLADSTVVSFPAERDLEGLRVPQVPRHRLTLQALFASPALVNVSASVRWTSGQFEDDQNSLALAPFWTVDALVSRALGGRVTAFAGVENLFDETYEIARTPARAVGSPRAFRGGVRVRLPR